MKFVIKSFTDLRSQPIIKDDPLALYDPLQETQLLFGEKIQVLKEQADWLYIQALDQTVIDNTTKSLKPYEGWIHGASIDSTCPNVPSYPRILLSSLCNQLVQDGQQFIDTPYVWGGMTNKGIDCSGLMHLLYRKCGYSIPRNAHDQYLVSKKCAIEELQKGDLLFLAKKNSPEKIFHVMLCINNVTWLEATQECGNVRIVSLKNKLATNQDCILLGGSLISSLSEDMLDCKIEV